MTKAERLRKGDRVGVSAILGKRSVVDPIGTVTGFTRDKPRRVWITRDGDGLRLLGPESLHYLIACGGDHKWKPGTVTAGVITCTRCGAVAKPKTGER